MKPTGRGPKAQRGTPRRYRLELRWPLVSPLSRQFEYQVSPHGKSCECETADLILVHKVFGHCRHITGSPGVIQARCFTVLPSAIALVHADHVHPQSHALVRDPHHVLRVARTFEPVHDDDRQCISSHTLPMAVTQDLDSGLHLDPSLFRSGQLDSPSQEKTRQRLDVPSSHPTAGGKYR